MKHKTCKNETIFCRNLCYPIYKYAHSSSRKNEKSEKIFQLYMCFIKKIPRIEQLNTMQLHAKEATRRCMSPKKWVHSSSSKNVKSEKNLLQLALYDMTEKSVHIITKISRIEHHATAIPCKRGHLKMLSAQ